MAIFNVNPAVNDILSESLPARKSKDETPVEQLKKALTVNGAGLDEVAERLAFQLHNSQTDAGTLKAAELIARVHGVREEMKEVSVPQVNIQIVNNGGNNLNMVQLLMPQTTGI